MYLAFDVETTGLETNCNVLTAYFIILDADYNKIDTLDLKIKYPYYIIYPKALEINKIDILKHDKDINSVYTELAILKLNSLKKTLIGKINVYGNSITEEKVVRDSLIISEGDILNISKIKKSIDNIDSKNFFKKTDYKITDSDLQKNSKDLNLYVKEQPTGSLSAGIGYGSSGGLLEGSINERNFLGKGIDLNFTGRLASEKVSGVFSYIDPNFMNTEKELNNYFFSNNIFSRLSFNLSLVFSF